MKSFIAIVFCFVFGLASLIGTFPADDTGLSGYNSSLNAYNASMRLDDHPWDHHNGRALAEIWIGRQAVNVGDLTQAELYGQVWTQIDKVCPSSKPGFCYSSWRWTFKTHYVTEHNSAFPIRYDDTYFSMTITDFRWYHEDTRRLLIGIAAGTLEALTKKGSPNCYQLPLHYKWFCNIGDSLEINLPDQDGHNNYLHLRFYGDQVYSGFRCCRDDKVHDKNVRRDVDQAVDGLGSELSSEFGQPYSRLTMCILDGWRLCEDCGAPCDSCGTTCPAS
ncbi:hypothetical protein IAQ61_003272 [Plenodomus lingam]|uniref:uncharacterized protein n=1 Tax=Leptosphaeria maculans TaxID=5022 RepID=UPI003333AA3A|nr:hypothetical protein IAQ61_003272 [Plenodomus lingam]